MADPVVTTFTVELARREATDLVDVTGGLAVLNRHYPVSHVHNRLLITATTAADASVAEAERVLGGAGLSHRRIDWVDGDPPAGADRLTSEGWTLAHSVLMRLTRPDERASLASNALTVPFGRLRDTIVQLWLGELPHLTKEQAAQLADRRLAAAAACDFTWHAVSVDGAPVSWCNLRMLDLDGTRAAQIEDVITLPAQRGHGHASAVVRHAVGTARAHGCDVVWLEADADDWPQHLYRRMGFDDVGRASSATLTDDAVLTHVTGSQDHR